MVFWPLERVASVVPEFRDRWRAVHADGRVAHGPALSSFLNPAWLVRDGEEWVDPAGFRHPDGELEPVEVPAEAPLPGLPVTASQVLYLRGTAGQAWWHTDLGMLAAGPSAEGAASLHPSLVPAGRGTYVNPHRLERLVAEGKRFRLTLDTGEELFVSWGAREGLQQGLGLESLYTLCPAHDDLYSWGVRDWPYELATALAPVLQRDHPELRPLIANQAWQAFRKRQAGQPGDYGTDHRGFWYVPMTATLTRAGLMRVIPTEEERANDPFWNAYLAVLGDLVGRDRLLTYRELGFRDPRPDLRRIGDRRPDIVVVAEKASLEESVLRLHEEFGVSYLVLGGIPSLLSTEFFAEHLPVKSVTVVGFVDYDPGGWIATDAFCQQLERYGVQARLAGQLVLPGRFSAEEIELYSQAIEAETPATEGKLKAWMERSGGIAGEARRMHADHLRPVERVVAAFREVAGVPSGR